MKRALQMLTVVVALTNCATRSNPTRSQPMSKSSTKKVLFVLTSHATKGDRPSGFWLSEATHPHHVLKRAGFEVDFTSPRGGRAPVDPESIDLRDPINAAFWNDPALRSAIENTRKPAEIDAREYAAIFYAGGHGTMWDLPDDQPLAELASRLYQNGGIVSAVCHGPAGLLNVKLSDGSYLIAGKEVAAFTNEEEKAAGMESVIPFSLADRLAARGARHVSAPLWQSKVVVSGRLITGQNPASATGVGEAVATLLAQ